MTQGKFIYWQWTNYLNNNQIKDINKIINKSAFDDEPDECVAKEKGKSKKFLKTKLIPWIKIKNYLPDIWEKIRHTNLHNFGFDISEPSDQDSVHYNVYSSKSKDRYDWHVDALGHDQPLVDMKFTILINISDKKYTGGKFKLFVGSEFEAPELNTSGNMIMFKSYTNHRVEKVLTGERKTLAIFIKGPSFK
jgi:predicted 2-oxoglutarate/Fe(II)-dependent dioxygenase YbiX